MFNLNLREHHRGTAMRFVVLSALLAVAGCGSEPASDSAALEPAASPRNQLVLKLVEADSVEADSVEADSVEADSVEADSVEADSTEEPGGDRAPYSSENASHVILIATIEKPTKQQAENKELRLNIEEVLRGKSLVENGEVVVKDSPDWHLYACLDIPSGAKRFSDRFAPGSSVGIFLWEDADHSWRVVDMTSLDTNSPAEQKAAWRKRIQRFVAVAEAPRADDPETRYKELLAGQPLDDPTFYALAYHRHPGAVRHIRQWLIDLSEMSETERSKSRQSFSGLLELLAGHHDAASIQPAVKVAAKLKVGERYSFFEFLPRLCRDADTKTLDELRDSIAPMVKELPPESELDSTTNYFLTHELHMAQAALKYLDERLEER